MEAFEVAVRRAVEQPVPGIPAVVQPVGQSPLVRTARLMNKVFGSG